MRTRKRLLLLGLVAIWIAGLNQSPVTASAPSRLCDSVCGSGSCDRECWLTQFDFDQGYPATTCGDQGYECCGDEFCNPATEACNGCIADCGSVSSCESECTTNADCGSGEVCNSAHECVPSSPSVDGDHTPQCGGECTKDSDCCGLDVCIGTSGLKYCGIPQSTYCPNAPSCASNLDCQNWAAWTCQLPLLPSNVYCDPGIDRCQFNQGFDCPDDTNVCY
jgi:Cys-rich repeat protein